MRATREGYVSQDVLVTLSGDVNVTGQDFALVPVVQGGR